MSLEGESFLGPKIPLEVKYLLNKIDKFDGSAFRKLLKGVIQAIETETLDDKYFDSLSIADLTDEELRYCFVGLLCICKLALKQSAAFLKKDAFKKNLSQLKLPQHCLDDLCNLLYGKRRDDLNAALVENRLKLNGVVNMRWRIDVIISSSSLSKVLEPVILMELELSNGSFESFELSLKKFHELRFKIASVLKVLNTLEDRQIFKI